MPVITSIKQQKNKERVNIYLDGKFGFGIDLENFIKFNLKVEQELANEEIDKITNKAEFQKILEKLLRFATLRLRSEKEIRDYLYRKKVPKVMYFDLFSKLKYFDLLDDIKFAEVWVRDRNEFRPKSKRILKQELQIKGISCDIIEEVLGNANIDENKIAMDMLKKKKFTEDTKKLAYLVRNGFSFEIAKEATKAYNIEHDHKG